MIIKPNLKKSTVRSESMAIQWKKSIIKINEFYGDSINKHLLPKADLHAHFQLSHPREITKKNSIHRQTLHLQINLENSEQDLLEDMSKTTRYKIRRAKRDGFRITYISEPNIDDVKKFAGFYDLFAKAKGIQVCKIEKLIALMNKKRLKIMSVYQEDNIKLASTATIVSNKTAIGLYAASARFNHPDINSQLISRANRYLHWHELVYFKNKGFHTFDLMGLTTDKNNAGHQKVNSYKRSFGGKEKVVYQSFISQSLLGIMCVCGLRFLCRIIDEIINRKDQDTLK